MVIRFLLLIGIVLASQSCSGGKSRMDCVDECRGKGRNFVQKDVLPAGVDFTGKILTRDSCRCD